MLLTEVAGVEISESPCCRLQSVIAMLQALLEWFFQSFILHPSAEYHPPYSCTTAGRLGAPSTRPPSETSSPLCLCNSTSTENDCNQSLSFPLHLPFEIVRHRAIILIKLLLDATRWVKQRSKVKSPSFLDVKAAVLIFSAPLTRSRALAHKPLSA